MEIGKNRDIQLRKSGDGVANLEREYQPLSPGTKILVMPQFSCMADEILGKKSPIFQAKI